MSSPIQRTKHDPSAPRYTLQPVAGPPSWSWSWWSPRSEKLSVVLRALSVHPCDGNPSCAPCNEHVGCIQLESPFAAQGRVKSTGETKEAAHLHAVHEAHRLGVVRGDEQIVVRQPHQQRRRMRDGGCGC